MTAQELMTLMRVGETVMFVGRVSRRDDEVSALEFKMADGRILVVGAGHILDPASAILPLTVTNE